MTSLIRADWICRLSNCLQYLFLGSLLLLPVSAVVAEELPAVSGQRIELYEGDIPGKLGDGNGHTPHGLLYLPKRNSNAAPLSFIVIYPGGGYGGLAMDHEGYQIADWCNTNGLGALICVYRHRGGGYGHPIPLQDAQQAIRLVRHHAKQWHIDPMHVGIIGFSAGGHLSSTVSTKFDLGDPSATDPIEKQSSRPDAAILCYPVIGMGKPYTHGGSQRNLLGDNASPELIASLSSEDQVTAETPPTFLLHTQEDKAVVVDNSLVYYNALVRHNVASALHIFPTGPHGVGLAKKIPDTSNWPQLCMDWLKSLGFSVQSSQP
jgi:acetyl esterase/lipase